MTKLEEKMIVRILDLSNEIKMVCENASVTKKTGCIQMLTDLINEEIDKFNEKEKK